MPKSKRLTLKKKQERFIKLVNKIIYDNRSIFDVTVYLGYPVERASSIIKCTRGKHFPNFLISKIDSLLEKLETASKNPELITAFNKPFKDVKKDLIKLPNSLVWIPFDLNLPVVDYNGTKSPPSITQLRSKKGIVTFRNTTPYDADGEIFIEHLGVATNLEPGTKLAIKRINKKLWKTDRYYVIIDASEQASLLELLPGDDNKTIKAVSPSLPEGPYSILLLERIVAVFSIVNASYIPTPNRNRPAGFMTQP